jgi:hypothetical protein
MRGLVCLAVLAIASPALAQAPGEVAPLPEPAHVDAKDPNSAVLLSLGVTTAGIVTIAAAGKANSGPGMLLGLAGVYLGPSTGRWYAGQTGGGSLALRALGGVAMVYGLALVLSQEDCDYECTSSSGNTGAVLLFGGLALWGGTTIYDIVMAKRDTDQWNATHLHLTPTVMSMAGHNGMGLSLATRF